MSKTAYVIDGGIGRVISAIPALRSAAVERDILVIAGSWDLMYIGSGLNVIESTSSYLKEATKDYNIIHPEPYHLKAVRDGKWNLVQGFDYLINGTSEDMLPHFKASAQTQAQVHNILSPNPSPEPKRYVAVQPFGSGGASDGRSMTMPQLETVITALLEEGYTPVLLGTEFISGMENNPMVIQPQGMDYYVFGAMISVCEYFIGCDSAGMHIARACGIPGTIVLGATSGARYYPEWFHELRNPDRPLYTQTLRLNDKVLLEDSIASQGVMNFDIDASELKENIKAALGNPCNDCGH